MLLNRSLSRSLLTLLWPSAATNSAAANFFMEPNVLGGLGAGWLLVNGINGLNGNSLNGINANSLNGHLANYPYMSSLMPLLGSVGLINGNGSVGLINSNGTNGLLNFPTAAPGAPPSQSQASPQKSACSRSLLPLY